MNNPRKIPAKYENPIDNHIFSFMEIIAPYFYKYGFTPNMITTLSFVCALVALFLIKNEYYILAGIFWFSNYIFDCLDGYIARKYDQVSAFGDLYDHITDVLTLLILLYIIYKKQDYVSLIIITIFSILCVIHMGCQEKEYDDKNVTSISLLKGLCSDKLNIEYTRYVGCATLQIVIVCVILSYKFRV